MASYTIGIFVATLNKHVEQAAKKQWSFSKIQKIENPYTGIVIYGNDIKHCDFDKLDEFTLENNRFFEELASFSNKFPKEKFVLMEEDEHGDVSSYQGLVCENGVVLVDERGDWREVLSSNEEGFKNGELTWGAFHNKRLRNLMSNLGIQLGKNVYFDFN